MKEVASMGQKNKGLGIFMSIANVLVVIIAIGLGRLYPLPVCIIAAIYFSVVLGVSISKHNSVKVSGGDTRQSKKEIQGYVAWTIFMVAVLGFQVWSVGGFQPKSANLSQQTPAELASQGAREAKSNTALPYEIDSVTTYTDITSDGNTIQYHYILHDLDTSSLSDDALKNSIQPNVCSNTSTKNLLDRGVDMQYLYSVKETSAQYSFIVTKNDC